MIRNHIATLFGMFGLTIIYGLALLFSDLQPVVGYMIYLAACFTLGWRMARATPLAMHLVSASWGLGFAYFFPTALGVCLVAMGLLGIVMFIASPAARESYSRIMA